MKATKKTLYMILALAFFALPGRSLAGSTDSYVNVVSTDSTGVVLEIWIPEPEFMEVSEEGGVYHRITVPGFGVTKDPGRPELPTGGTLLGLPDGSKPTIRVLESDTTVYGGLNVYPAPRPVVVEEDGTRELVFKFAKDVSVYNTDGFFPADRVEVGFSGLMRDQLVVQLKFHPFRFNPVTGELIYCSRIKVAVDYNLPVSDKSLAQATFKKRGPTEGASGAYERLLQGTIINYDAIRR